MIVTTIVTAPVAWGPALVNNDYSGMSADEVAQCRAWLEREGVSILDVAREPEGDPVEIRFTRQYRLYVPDYPYESGFVRDYVAVVRQ